MPQVFVVDDSTAAESFSDGRIAAMLIDDVQPPAGVPDRKEGD
ncbi:hypothetical protein [Burkholderia cepacia]|nr:hypothetical protein [Burkholderia cepacia]MDN7763012.1 hypothetical protein [Burkholderia cepacia]